MAIWGFFGQLGQGKTTVANYFMKIQFQKGRKIVSHAKLNFPYIYMPIDEIFDKALNETEFFRDKLLFMDEFHLIMESRRSSASVNVDFSQSILVQLGKLDCDLYYTSQLLSQMDLRIKEMQTYFFFCKKQFRVGLYLSEILEKIDFDRRIVMDQNGKLVPFDIELKYLIQRSDLDMESGSAILPWEIIQNLFGNFDTREIIKFDRKKYLK